MRPDRRLVVHIRLCWQPARHKIDAIIYCPLRRIIELLPTSHRYNAASAAGMPFLCMGPREPADPEETRRVR
jgi:hypothetical protein